MSNKNEKRLVEKLDEVSNQLLKEFPQHSEYIALQKSWNESVLRYFNRWLPPRGGRIVSIGSFLGAPEIVLSDEVREVVCCDLDDYLPIDRPANVSFNKISLDSDLMNLPEGHFDACFCIEVLEHLRWSPMPLLQWVVQHCNFVLISTPDNKEWPPVKNAPWTTTKHFSRIPFATAESTGNPKPMEHCKQYSQTEFIDLLDQAGFRVIELQRIGEGGHQMLALASPRTLPSSEVAVACEVQNNPLLLVKQLIPYLVKHGVRATLLRIGTVCTGNVNRWLGK
ncbi:MAG: methyltransferase domain-containing protein [Desulfobacteraceae bacterium]|nr:methyltransferase domain-containing protein [Desulfobacteraceae bacterium]